MDGSEIGLFGTLRLMKRTTDEQVAAFPIDEETVTFGRDPTCSVRLYYPEISALHAKIVFQERKAFLVVLGDAGLTIDGCPVLPSTNASLPTTIPVSNNCEIEIHKKHFIFSYPPKQLRSSLYNIDSPVKSENEGGGGRRKLRMSMIHSAQVFTPRGKPSSDPLANLRILQSPLKQLVPSPRKPSALKNSHVPEPDEIEEEIVLVESNTPHVVQEDKDLVILERVDVQAPPPTPSVQRPRPSMNIYKTPNRRTRPSLHRAVLIRSVHRAVMAREEEEEEKEVEEVIVNEATVEEGEEHENDNDEEFNDEQGTAGNGHGESDEDGNDADLDTIEEPTPQPSTWRKSLNAVRARVVWPFRSSSTAPEENDDDKQDEHEDEEDEVSLPFVSLRHINYEHQHDQMDTDQDAQPPPPSSSPPPIHITPRAQPHLTPARAPRPLGSFMTPQVSHPQSDIGVGIGRGAGRNSFGGALRRIRVEPKWRIGDIEVRGVEVKEEEKAGTGLGRTRVSEEEKKVSTFVFLVLGKWNGGSSLGFVWNCFFMRDYCDTGCRVCRFLAYPSSPSTFLSSLCHFSPHDASSN
ncbi:hypothetical protein F4604DRAFT_1572094 [Suillus subluteus]|nr:hypothetical protein F4604DRAFT_1572094 [Suillus subluteus]